MVLRPSWRRRNYRAARTSQHSVSISVRPRRRKCMQFCSTRLSTCEEEPSCNIHVFWWQLLITKKIHTFACRYSMLPCSRFFEVHTYFSECWPTRRVRRQWLLDEIQQQLSVFVLSGPATVTTNVATASTFLADGWSEPCRQNSKDQTRKQREGTRRTCILQPPT